MNCFGWLKIHNVTVSKASQN